MPRSISPLNFIQICHYLFHNTTHALRHKLEIINSANIDDVKYPVMFFKVPMKCIKMYNTFCMSLKLGIVGFLADILEFGGHNGHNNFFHFLRSCGVRINKKLNFHEVLIFFDRGLSPQELNNVN